MDTRMKFGSTPFLATAITGLMLAAPLAVQAFPNVGGIIKKVGLPNVGEIMSGPMPVSTNIKDAIYGDANKDTFKPPVAVSSMMGLARSDKGGFVLKSGYFEMVDQSYCLHAGTYGPGGGDGYLYAPVKGSAQEAVTAILQNSVAHPDIDQRNIQLLLWAIVSRAKFEDLNTELKIVASQLLSKKQIASLNRNALSVLTSPELSRVTGGLPAPVRQVLQAEADMRRMLSAPGLVYADMERAAVLAGKAPMGEGSVQTPSNRWSKHPDGYYIRFIPSGYSHTLVQIWVEQGSVAIGRIYNPATHIAVPGNTSRQRLAQSGRVYGE
jgi:hypothetical protein